jgi:hypothetical protein
MIPVSSPERSFDRSNQIALRGRRISEKLRDLSARTLSPCKTFSPTGALM